MTLNYTFKNLLISKDLCVTIAFLHFYPSSGDHKQKFYWGHKEILIPVYKNMGDAMKKLPDVDVLINFASLRSAFDSTMETMQYPQVKFPPAPSASYKMNKASKVKPFCLIAFRFTPLPSSQRASLKPTPGRSSRKRMRRVSQSLDQQLLVLPHFF